MLKCASFRIVLLMVGFILIMVLAPRPPNPPPPRLVKTPAEIYKEADYLAHLEIVEEDEVLHLETKGYCAGTLISHKNKYRILTVAHIKDPRLSFKIKEIRFYLKGQPGIYNATLHSSDTKKDCALLEISKIAGKDFVFLGRLPKFGSGKNLEIGEPVYSLGSPLNLKFNFGAGIVENKIDDDPVFRPGIIHDAPIAPGSSGGPLLDKYGDVVGMNVAVRRDFTTFGNARYIEDALEWLKTIE